MSVINKMLRDLDQRQAKLPQQTNVSTQPVGQQPWPARQSTRSDSTQAGTSTTPRRMALWSLSGVLVAMACAAWWWQSQAVLPANPASTPMIAAASLPVAPASEGKLAATVLPQPMPVVQTQVDAPSTIGPVAMTVPAEVPLPPTPALKLVEVEAAKVRPEPVAPTATAPAKVAVARESSTSLGLRMESNLSLPKTPEKILLYERASNRLKPETTSHTGTSASPNDALERSQSLWNAGSREAAIDLLQDAVAVAERQANGVSYPQGNPLLLPLVRELTRLLLAESRHGAVWELLVRLEPQLGKAPDLWAIRGNAAQRLGRHQDSVHAYLVALQSRPNEQRWLLGAAVSLAALGQPSSAAEMADKARAVGTVSPDVLAYLRQQGVPLKDK